MSFPAQHQIHIYHPLNNWYHLMLLIFLKTQQACALKISQYLNNLLNIIFFEI